MKFLSLGILLVVMLTSYSCKKKDLGNTDKDDYFIFGEFHGFCAGPDCVNIYKLQDGKLFEDTKDQYPELTTYNGDFIEQSSTEYNLAKDIPASVPEELLKSNNQIFGSPDSHDQGGFFIEIKTGKDVQYWLIDKDKSNIPDYLAGFVDELQVLMDKI